MHTHSTAQLILRGRQLRDTIFAAENELKLIENILRTRALAMPHETLTQANREGRRAILRDEDQELSVTFESDLLKASFSACTPLAKSLQALLETEEFDELFSTKTTHERVLKDGYKFRARCTDLLGDSKSAQVVETLKDRDKNGIVKSKTVIEWKA